MLHLAYTYKHFKHNSLFGSGVVGVVGTVDESGETDAKDCEHLLLGTHYTLS